MKQIVDKKKEVKEEHVLVCLSSSPSNAKIIDAAAKMAHAFNSQFTALFVQSSDFEKMNDTDRKRLQYHIHLAEKQGATIATVYGEDISFQIAEFARLSKVTKIVLGRSRPSKYSFLKKATLTERLIENAPHLDIYIIPDLQNQMEYQKKKRKFNVRLIPSLMDSILTILIIVGVTFVGMIFSQFYFTEENIITVYILGVLLTSIFTQTPVCSVIASLLSVLVFNFFFTEPRLTLHAYDPGYPFTFMIMLIVSLITSSLTNKLKKHAQQSAQSAYRTKLLFETNQLLQKANNDLEMIDITSSQLMKLLERDIVAYVEENGLLKDGKIFTLSFKKKEEIISSLDNRGIVQWVFDNRKKAGATTDVMTDASCVYYPIHINEKIYGVIGICLEEESLDSFENNILLSILGECALAINNSRNAKEKEANAVLAENEKLRANLLRTISHDLRTPLTSISGNASNLLSNSQNMEEEIKQQIFNDIYDDSIWLISLVENLLSITRLEEGRMNFNISTQIVEDVILEALHHIHRKKVHHKIELISTEKLLLAQMDAKLIIQVIINLVENAIKYTPEGSKIIIETEEKEDMIYIHVKDNGPGISDENKLKVFDMFYCGNQKIADSRRSLGLGLPLCKSIIEAHEGAIVLKDNIPQGCIFTFSLKKGEVNLHE